MATAPWTTSELEALEMYYPVYGAKWDQWKYILPGRSQHAITGKANRMGLNISKRQNAWKDWEVDALKEHYPKHGSKWVGWKDVLPNRSNTSIRMRAHTMGLFVDTNSKTNFTEGQKRFILKGVLKIADALHAPPRAVAIEVENLRDIFDKEYT